MAFSSDDPETRQRLGSRQNEAVRVVARKLYVERFHENTSKLAEAIGMKQPNVSRFLSRKQGTTVAVARRVAELAGLNVADFEIDSPPESSKRPRPVGTLPGWEEAEQGARKLLPRLPDTAWSEAREYVTPYPPKLSAEYVAHLALAADLARAEQTTPTDTTETRKAS